MKNIEKYNKYYGKDYDVKRIVYCLIFVLVIITFFFGPIGNSDESYLSPGMNYDQVNTQESHNSIIPTQDKDLNNQNVIEVPPEKEKSENKDNNENKGDDKNNNSKEKENEDSKKEETNNVKKEGNKESENNNKIGEEKNKQGDEENKVNHENNKINDENENNVEENNGKNNDEINNNEWKGQEKNENIINKEKNPIIAKKKSKGFWKKLFLMTGFLGIIYYLVWKESNNPGDDDNDDDNDKNNKNQKNQKTENNGYLLLNNNEEYDI